MSNGVETPTRKSMAGDPRLRKIRALRSGVEAMRAAGQAYLPKEEAEVDSDYADRLARSWLFPGLDMAVEDVADRVFAREVTLGDDVPDDIVALSENITAEGRNLNTFARSYFEDGVEAGISFAFIDGPTRNGDETLADEINQNLRPYVSDIKAEHVLGWKTTLIGNKTVLSQFRFWEMDTVPDPENRFADMEVEQIRVLTRGEGIVEFETYRNIDGIWEAWDSGFMGIPEIPVVAFYTKRTGFFTADPPYEKLADLNIAHWQSASDQRHILHFARVPILALFGFEGEVSLGPNRAFITSKGPGDADLKIVEHSGAAIGAGRDDLKDLELRMQSMGVQLMLPTPGSQTATGKALDAAAAATPLAMMANSLKDALEMVIDFMNQFMGAPAGTAGSVNVNTDFGLSLLNGADLTFLLNAVNTGQISRQTFLAECVRRNVLMEGIDPEEEAERIETEMPEPLTLPVIDEGEGDDQE